MTEEKIQAILKYYKKRKKVFVHFKGLDCGHFHVSYTRDKKSVDCHACLKLLQNPNEQLK